jgi:hypothetical protein
MSGLTERLVHLADADCCLCELAGEGVGMVDVDVDVDFLVILGDGGRNRLRMDRLRDADVGIGVLLVLLVVVLLREPVLQRCTALELGVHKAGTVESTVHVAVVLQRARDGLLLDIWDRVGVGNGDEDG